MQKIIIDTNVFVSALQRSYPFFIVDNVFVNNNIELAISNELFKEYFEVLNRKKFSKFNEFFTKAQSLLVDIENRGIKYTPTLKVNIIGDLDDNKLLELAETCNADFLITGNTNDFTMQVYKKTQVVTPKNYWENHLP